MSFQSAVYVIPTWARVLEGNLYTAVQRSKTLNDGLIRYRSHAFAHKPSQGRTVLIRKHFLNFFFADVVFVIIHSAS